MRRCPNCKKKFQADPPRRVKYCSQFCYQDLRRKNMKPTTYPKLRGRHVHRIIAEKKLGRKLRRGEIVHHRDNNKQNIRPGNIQVLKSQSAHARIHFKGSKQKPSHIKKRVRSRRLTILRKSQ